MVGAPAGFEKNFGETRILWGPARLLCVYRPNGPVLPGGNSNMVTAIIVIGVVLVGACSWHLMRRFNKSRS